MRSFSHVLLVWLAAHAASGQIVESHSFTNLHREIPDGDWSGLSDRRSLTSSIATITLLRVKLHIAGEFNGDLYAYVRHIQPGRTNLCVLLNRPGRTAANPEGYADAGLNVTFDDAAPNGDIHVYQALNPQPSTLNPLTGSWQPDGRSIDPSLVFETTPRTTTLASFSGASGSGEWTLYCADIASGGTNQLVSWELELHGVPACSGVKGDVFPRPAGSGLTNQLSLADWVLIGNFVAGLTEGISSCESNRADCAPAPCGNGLLTVGDWVQAGRYVAQLDPQTNICVAAQASASASAMALADLHTDSPSVPGPGARSLRLENMLATPGTTHCQDVVLQAQGNEHALAFSLGFDTRFLVFLSVHLGSEATDATLIANTNYCSEGRVGFVVGLPPSRCFAPGLQRVLTVCFRAANVPSATTTLAFTGVPVMREVTDPSPAILPLTYENGTIAINGAVLKLSTRLTSDAIEFTVAGPQNAIVSIETSSDLTIWSPLFSLTNRAGTMQFRENLPANPTARFYRAAIP